MKKLLVLSMLILVLTSFSQDAFIIGGSFSTDKYIPSYNFSVGCKMENANVYAMFGGGSRTIGNLTMNTFIMGFHYDAYITENFFFGSGINFINYDMILVTELPMVSNTNTLVMNNIRISSNYKGVVIPLRVGFKFGVFSPFISYDIVLLSSDGVHITNTSTNEPILTNVPYDMGTISGGYIRFGVNLIIPVSDDTIEGPFY